MLRVNLLPKLTQADYHRKWLAKQTPEYKAKRKARHKTREQERYATDAGFRARKTLAGENWMARHPVRAQAKRQSQKLRHRYGLSLEDVNRMLAAQAGLCAICGDVIGLEKREGVQKLHVDHDHT